MDVFFCFIITINVCKTKEEEFWEFYVGDDGLEHLLGSDSRVHHGLQLLTGQQHHHHPPHVAWVPQALGEVKTDSIQGTYHKVLTLYLNLT